MLGLFAIMFCITSGFCSTDCSIGEFIICASCSGMPAPAPGSPCRRSPRAQRVQLACGVAVTAQAAERARTALPGPPASAAPVPAPAAPAAGAGALRPAPAQVRLCASQTCLARGWDTRCTEARQFLLCKKHKARSLPRRRALGPSHEVDDVLCLQACPARPRLPQPACGRVPGMRLHRMARTVALHRPLVLQHLPFVDEPLVLHGDARLRCYSILKLLDGLGQLNLHREAVSTKGWLQEDNNLAHGACRALVLPSPGLQPSLHPRERPCQRA